MKKINQKGITLVALVITIIILIILAGVSIGIIFGENGLIERAKEATFKSQMAQMQEEVTTYWFGKEAEALIETKNLTVAEKLPVSGNADQDEFGESLVTEIKEARELDDISGINFYVIDKSKINTKGNHTYIIDGDTLKVYDVEGEKYGGKIHHSADGNGSAISSSSSSSGSVVATETEASLEGNIGWLKPNLNGFNKDYTKLMFYNMDNMREMIEVSVQEYLDLGKPITIERNGAKYKFDSYSSNMWANVKATANGMETWWVWIPRYAYKINGSTATEPIEVVFIDMNNRPLGTKYENSFTVNDNGTITINGGEYIIHPAFTITESNGSKKQLEGIWMSKFEPNTVRNNIYPSEAGDCLAPDLSGYDEDNTYIVYWNEDLSGTKEVSLSQYNSDGKQRVIYENNHTYTFYDYTNKIYANIKTSANENECWWVWIPRYAYKISSGTTEVDVVFIGLDNKPINKGKYGKTLKDGMIVHPGFTINESDGSKTELDGIWMSKYEPSWV